MAIKINNNIVIYNDETFRVAADTTANRPAEPQIGMIRYNTTDNTFEGYGTEWGPLGGGGGDGVDETARTLAILALS